MLIKAGKYENLWPFDFNKKEFNREEGDEKDKYI